MSDSEDRPAKRQRVEENVHPAAQLLPTGNGKGLFSLVRANLGRRAAEEPEVGITEYVAPDVPPITGILKHRFTDFLVFEVGLDGQVVRLRDIRGPIVRDRKPEQRSDTADQLSTAEIKQSLEWSDDKFAPLASVFGSNNFAKLKEMVEAGPQANPKASVDTLPILTKDERTSVHQKMRQASASKLITETLEDSATGEQRIVVKWNHSISKNGGGHNHRGKPRGPARASAKHEPPYIHLTLQKTNREAHDALHLLKAILRIQPKDIGTAGTKDKRGITTQRVSIRRGHKTVEDVWVSARGGPRASAKLTEKSKEIPSYDRNVRIGDIEYAKTGFELGQLKGNKFVVTIRDVQSNSLDSMTAALTTLRDHGFINYFGMQRFGTAPIPTHVIGLALLLSDWQLAVNLILGPREGEYEDTQAARQKWQQGDIANALKLMPKRAVAERALLEHINRHGSKDPLNALSMIPKNLRMMYVHSWQSYIWNRATSERVKLVGPTSIVVGDLVVAGEGDIIDSADGAEDLPGARNIPPVHVVTEEDIQSNKYTVFDVVLPMPGFAVRYPEGKIGEVYRQLVSEDGIDIDNMFRRQKEYSLGGAYRKVMHLPTDVSWRFLRYTSPTQDLAQSDEDRLLNRPAPDVKEHDPSQALEEGALLALQVELTLGSSTYATMALREILKSWTSAAHMKGMTQKMEQDYEGTQAGSTAAVATSRESSTVGKETAYVVNEE